MENKVSVLCLTLLAAIMVVHGDLDCKKANSKALGLVGEFVVAYQISDHKHTLMPCFAISSRRSGMLFKTDFLYNQNGNVKRIGTTVPFDNGTVTYAFDDLPYFVYNLYTEERQGVRLIYLCPPRETDEVILVAYNKHQPSLAEKADEVADQLTDEPEKYKINRKHCAN